MCNGKYDIVYEDLNPTFLFTCKAKRIRKEEYHCHDFTEICYIVSGTGEYIVDGSRIAVKEGDVLIYNPGVYHEAVVQKSKEQMTEFFVAFDNYEFKGMKPNRFVIKEGEFHFHTDSELRRKILKLCCAIATEQTSDKPGRYFMMKSYLIQLLLILLREREEDKKSLEEGYTFESVNKKYVVEQIVSYIDEHYKEKISLDKIAKNMYLSPFYISKIFKSEIGDTPINYVIKVRLEKAKELLEANEELNVQTVSAYVGYEDAYHFSKLFKKHFGVSPSCCKKVVH